jgi:hypothetical protein
LDLLFAGKSHLSWRAEKEFELLKSKGIEHAEDVAGNSRPEKGGCDFTKREKRFCKLMLIVILI